MKVKYSDFFTKHSKYLRKIKRVFCGFSGGADSTALLLILNKYSESFGFKLKAVHFQHGLRGEESHKDSKFCMEFCENRNIDFVEINLDVKSALKGNESFEDRARKMRLAQWKILAANTDSAIALGHNADDVNENIIIRLLRGSNVSGLTSLREIQNIDGICILRPLLNFSRNEIEDFLREQNVSEWRSDTSNQDNQILRNYIRNVTLSELFDICEAGIEGMRKAAKALLDDALFIESETEKYWKYLSNKGQSFHSISTEEYLSLHNAIKIRILRKWLSANLGKDYIPGYELLVRLESACYGIKKLKNKNRIFIPLPHSKNSFIEVNKKNIKIPESFPSSPAIIWDWHKFHEIKWKIWKISAQTKKILSAKDIISNDEFSALFDMKSIPDKLKISSPLTGDKMIPFGMNKVVNVKKLFENKKIPANEKSIYPVFSLPESDEIIWIGGIRRSNFAPVKKNIKALYIKISRLEQ